MMQDAFTSMFTKESLMGMLKSWTVYLGALIVAWPTIAEDLSGNFNGLFGEDMSTTITRVMGVLVILLRVKTTQSLTEKGAPAKKGKPAKKGSP